MKGEDLQEARMERKGAAAEDRPSEVEEILEPRERLGYQVEKPILDCDYSEYPRGDDILRPEAGRALRTLADHPLVSGVEDIGDELATDVETVRKAADLHGIDLADETDFDVDVNMSRLHALLGAEWPDGLVRPDNPVTVATLYVEYGLSVGEIADILEEVMDRPVPERMVRQTLTDARLLEGRTTDEQEARLKQGRGRGLTISVD